MKIIERHYKFQLNLKLLYNIQEILIIKFNLLNKKKQKVHINRFLKLKIEKKRATINYFTTKKNIHFLNW